MFTRNAVAIVAALFLVACTGGGGGTPVSPTDEPPPPVQDPDPPPPTKTCPDGTEIPNDQQCPAPPPTMKTCPDGSEIPADQQCPAPPPAMKTCPDGSEVPEDQQCPPQPEPEQFKDAALRLLQLSDTVIRAQAGPCGTDGECLAFVLGGLIETHPLRGDTNLSELDIESQSYEAVAARGGVSLAKARDDGETFGASSYGGWLSHSFFHVHVNTITTRDITISRSWFPNAYSAGDATGTNPTAAMGSATWTGAMVGVDISDSPRLANRVSGDAAISIHDLTLPQVDVDFTNIRDEDTGAAHPDMSWSGLDVASGTFNGRRLRGQFYGPNHEEVGGVFYRSGILGAFGGVRQ